MSQYFFQLFIIIFPWKMTRSFIFKTLYPLCLGVSNLVEIGSVGLEKMLKMFKIYGQTKGGNISSKVHPNSAQMS